MDDVVVMSKIATKKQRIRDDLAVNAEKHRDLFPLNPVLWAITKGSFF
jgi:predicted DNA repair protein MutK